MIVCTSICSNYLPKAMVLAKSLKTYNPNVKIYVCLVEKEINTEAAEYEEFDGIILAKDLGVHNFEQFIFKHTIVEASTAVKGQLFKYLMNKYQDEKKFVYLDPDIKVFGELRELEDLLDSNQIVLTPHIFEKENDIEDVKITELSVLKHGIFNLGFLGIARGDESNKFIEWWNSRLNMFCYDDIPNGIFTDQKWIDLAICFFDIYIFKHPGYNLASWNYSTRKVTKVNNSYLVNNEPLRFLHFSGFDSGTNDIITKKYVQNIDDPIYFIRDNYINDLDNAKQELLGQLSWSYDFFNSGEKVLKESRIIYRENSTLQDYYTNPFEYSNECFVGILKEIDDSLWDRMISELSEEIQFDKQLLEKMRFDLSTLKKTNKNQLINYVIWGASGSGLATEKIVKRILPNFQLIYYIDKFKKGYIKETEILTPNDINSIKFDFIIIATSIGKNEVEEKLKDIGLKYLKKYIYGYGVL